MVRRTTLWVVVGLAVAGLLAGCAGGRQRSPRAGPDWSRGVVVGDASINDVVALYPEPDGQRVHLAWGWSADDKGRIRYLQLDGEGTVVEAHDLPLAVRSPRRVHLLPGTEEGLVAFYLSGVGDNRRLYAVRLSRAGEVLGGPVEVSGGELEVDDYAVVSTVAGADVFWCNDTYLTRGLYHRQVDHLGRPLGVSRLMVEGGTSPSAQTGDDGRVHLAWLYEPGALEEHIYYAAFDPATQELGTPVRVGQFTLNPKATLYGPVVALGRGRVYIAWAWQQLAATLGAAAGEGECWYVTFPFGAAGTTDPRHLALPSRSRPEYQPAQGAFAYTQLAAAREGGSALVYMPNPVAGERDEAALGLAFHTATRTGSRVQIGVVYLAGSELKGYQIAGQGGAMVMRPVLAADGQNHLHLAWLEPAGFHHYRVYYASTRQEVRAALGRFGRDDVIDGAYTVAWTLVQSVSMFPVAFVWLAVPLAWVVGYYLVKADADLGQRGPRIALGVAVALYILCKIVLMPGSFVEAAPFVSYLSPAVANIYMGVLPVAILLVASGALWLYLRRGESRTLLVGYVVFGATDALITLLLYAPGMLG